MANGQKNHADHGAKEAPDHGPCIQSLVNLVDKVVQRLCQPQMTWWKNLHKS